MVRAGERQLEAELAVINALNVFPVPDGDTGTNMLATVREALSQAASAATFGQAAQQLAQGAMLGARGNSGVILSQLFRALSEVLAHCSCLSQEALAHVFARAAELAYATVEHPVEGTMLSVLTAISSPCSSSSGERGATAPDVLGCAAAAAEAALARTPDQLPVLKEAQVVDSGGYGLLLLLRGWCEALSGGVPPLRHQLLGLERARQQVAAGDGHPADLVRSREGGYGYCVTLLLEGVTSGEAAVRQHLAELGESVLVVAVDGQLKLHLHVPAPDPVLRYAATVGVVTSSEISNIDEQAGTVEAPPALPVVAVAAGKGLARVFRGLGVAVVEGGQGQNPSTAELLTACDAALGQYPEVFLLPNNGNVLATARQAAAARTSVRVVPSKSIPQGIAAVLAYVPEAPLERMMAALESVLSAEIVTAARAAIVSGTAVDEGDAMVMVEGSLAGVGEVGLAALAAHPRARAAELCTIYYGAAASEQMAESLEKGFHRPDLEVQIVRGDQPQALFILSFE